MSSSQGVTGSVNVLPQASSVGRNVDVNEDGVYDDGGLETAFQTLRGAAGAIDITGAVNDYLQAVNSSPPPSLASRKVGITRLEPSAGFTRESMGKGIIRSNLYPYYKTAYPSSYWGYKNYLSLNFISGSGFSTGSALLYANPIDNTEFTNIIAAERSKITDEWYREILERARRGGRSTPSPEDYAILRERLSQLDTLISSNSPTQAKLTPSGAFTFEFYCKPTMRVSGTYHAGTIMHVSSSFAISLVSGSTINQNGMPDSFKVLLQLSHSADISPSQIDLSPLNNTRTFPNDLVFLSNDNITFNGWHHVAIRWGGNNTDFGSGSFFIDGNQAGTFYIPSESITRTAYAENSNGLFIGNFYEGENTSASGVKDLFVTGTIKEGFTDPFGSTNAFPLRGLNHQFGGELHEIRIWQAYRSIEQILSGTRNGISLDSTLKFYLGPFFTHESLERDVLTSPFSSFLTSSNSPFDAELAFSVGGHLINAENHLRDLVSGYFPRLLNMTASQTFASFPTSFPNITGTNGYLFVTESALRKNLLILPCDNGKFVPDFSLLQTASATPFFGNSPGEVILENLIMSGTGNRFYGEVLSKNTDEASTSGSLIWPSGSVYPSVLFPSGTISTSDNKNVDDSSNLVSFFNISNLLYGSKIHPGTFVLADNSFTGSKGLLSFAINDNEAGGLYRADCTTPHAKWNTVGTLLYEEGIACITSPYWGDLFGKNGFEVNFRGEQPVPLLTANVQVPAWKINSSSSPSYLPLIASDYANENSNPIVYITRVNFHDENLNIVGRAEIAQPVAKRLSDKFLIKVKFDF